MKNLILVILTIGSASAWEINTHRAIDRLAIEKSENLKSFVDNAGIEKSNYKNETYKNIKKGELT